MAYTVDIWHDGGDVQIELEASVKPGTSPTYNPPGKAYPGDPPYVDDIWGPEIVEDELDRDLDVDELIELHDAEVSEQIIEQAKDRAFR